MKTGKKWLFVFVIIFFLLSIGSIYILIPSELNIVQSRPVKCNVAGAFRVINDGGSWKKWWPAEGINEYSYHLSEKLYREVPVSLEEGGTSVNGKISFFPIGVSDSTVLQWQVHLTASYNPIKRIQQYREAIGISRVMDTALSLMGGFLEKKEHVYGMDIRDAMSADSCLVVTRRAVNSYPATADIYKEIGQLRSYISREGAKETDYPMLHVSPRQDGGFEVMVAIPVNRQLKGEGAIFPRNFVPWKILIGEVRGGGGIAEEAMGQLQQYLDDYRRTAMAIPFQSLVTERDREPDSARWITRVVVPVY